MRIVLGPVGRIATGNVLDCAKGPLERTLRFYDPQLYVKWNPKKLKGWGCWEVRRRPENKQIVETVYYKGNSYSKVEYKEYDIVHHILDVSYLNYNILTELKRIDTWQDGAKGLDWVKQIDYREAKAQERIEEQSEEQRQYAIKQHKSQIRDLMEYTRSGGDPSRIAQYWR